MECLAVKYLPLRDISVPCGKCAFCLATRRSDWSTRLEYEAKKWLDKKFITLTYADPHLYFLNGISQLHKPHLQNYFKRLRKAGYRLRYYAVGEYGSKTYRPHYHVLLFGSIPENVLRKSWEFGNVHIGQVTAASVSYCLKYVVNGRAKGMRIGRVRPYATMSRKPGLGANYLTSQMIRWHQSKRKNYVLVDGQKRHLPRYYKDKIFSKIDRVRIAVRDQKAAFESLRRELFELGQRGIVVSKVYPRGALSYLEEQRRIAARRILDKNRKNLTI